MGFVVKFAAFHINYSAMIHKHNTAEVTSVKIRKALHNELQKRAGTLGMTMGDYVERLLLMALDINKGEPVKEFEALLAYMRKDQG